MKTFFAFLVFLFESVSAYSQVNIITQLGLKSTVGEFYGYEMHDFVFNSRASKIVIPKVASKGNPWIWRARFWGHEPQTDTVLLSKGYHVVYCDVVELFGNTKAVKIWNKFYALMQKGGLAEKVVMEGMSRGGLYVYNWAAENPEKIACIYVDAPVLDIRSWPGGLGKGSGSPAEWKACRKVWNLNTEEKIKNFRGSPLDKIDKIVKGKYPMLHVCGDADDVVPISENTDLFESKVKAAGGCITVIRKPGVKHHPHSLVDPRPIVQFIENNYKY